MANKAIPVLGHVIGKTSHYVTYRSTRLPEQPTRGVQTSTVTCQTCSKAFKVQAHSRARTAVPYFFLSVTAKQEVGRWCVIGFLILVPLGIINQEGTLTVWSFFILPLLLVLIRVIMRWQFGKGGSGIRVLGKDDFFAFHRENSHEIFWTTEEQLAKASPR